MKRKSFIFRSLLLIFQKHVGNINKQNYTKGKEKKKKKERKACWSGSYHVEALKINETESTLWYLQQS